MDTRTDLKPIDTVYKGYKFRSRLEARWAVFLDELDIKWEYEPQGYELPIVGKYLPDFYLPERKAHLEIKNESLWKPAEASKIYMAGRMTEPCYRPFSIKRRYGEYWPVYGELYLTAIYYTGPFRTDLRNHGIGYDLHGVKDFEGWSDETPFDIMKRSYDGIDKCDVFFLLLEDKEAFGSLIELGYAVAKGKKIIVGAISDLILLAASKKTKQSWYEDFPPFLADWGFETDRPLLNAEMKELWFAFAAADDIIWGSDREIILAQLLLRLKRNPLTREQQLCDELAIATRQKCFIAYGDPLDSLFNHKRVLCFEAGYNDRFYSGNHIHNWSGLLPHHSDFHIIKAGTAARQARFEHGQSGAR